MELLLIRHARPHHVTNASGGADPDLTPDGVDQAERLAAAIGAGRYGSVGRMVSSPLLRAVQTAEPTAAALGLAVTTDERLVEFTHGWAEYGLVVDAYPSRRDALRDMNIGRVAHRTFDPSAFRDRVVAGIDALVGDVPAAPTTAVICHGGVINAYLSHILGSATMFFTEPYYTSVSRVLADADGYREALSLNEVDHLKI